MSLAQLALPISKLQLLSESADFKIALLIDYNHLLFTALVLRTSIIKGFSFVTEDKNKSTSILKVDTAQEAEVDLYSLDNNDKTYTKIGLLALFITFVIFGGWAAFAPLSSATVAKGDVVVLSNNRVVEHYEGGIISKILVKEGDTVKAGQPLLKLSPTQAQSELSVLQSRLYELQASNSRLMAERSGESTVTFSQALLNKQPSTQIDGIIQGQINIFNTRKQALDGQLEIFTQRIIALEQQVKGLISLNNTLDTRIRTYRSDLKDWEAMYKQQFTDKTRLQDMRRELARLQGEKSNNLSEMARLKVKVVETNSELLLKKQQFQENIATELSKTQSDIADLESKKLALLDRLARIQINAPVTGKINGLSIYTLGQVVKPGEQLMEIVPNTRDFGVKARIGLASIHKVHEELLADVRFSSFKAQETHVVEGKVVHLSADKFTDSTTGEEYFEVKIELTPKGIKQMQDDSIPLLPGMPVEVLIKTGQRTLLGYFTTPFQNMFARSLNED